MLLVIGGHSRNLGKTSLAAGLIRKFRDRNWTAVKITQYGHSVCSDHGDTCACKTEAGEPYALSEEFEPTGTDSGRFLTAGAARSLWLRTEAGELRRAATIIQKILAQSENVIVESNSVLELVRPHTFLMMLDFGCQDFKQTSLRYMDRADAFVVIDRGISVPLWDDAARGLWDAKPRFAVTPPRYVTPAVADFVSSRL
jgi:molybdopterin-guanine dinucleotide biosynthesis protein